MYYVTALGRHNFDKVVVFVIFWMSTTINVSFTIASFVLTHRQNYGQTIPISLLKMKMKKLFHIQCEYLYKKLYWYVFLLFSQNSVQRVQIFRKDSLEWFLFINVVVIVFFK